MTIGFGSSATRLPALRRKQGGRAGDRGGGPDRRGRVGAAPPPPRPTTPPDAPRRPLAAGLTPGARGRAPRATPPPAFAREPRSVEAANRRPGAADMAAVAGPARQERGRRDAVVAARGGAVGRAAPTRGPPRAVFPPAPLAPVPPPVHGCSPRAPAARLRRVRAACLGGLSGRSVWAGRPDGVSGRGGATSGAVRRMARRAGSRRAKPARRGAAPARPAPKTPTHKTPTHKTPTHRAPTPARAALDLGVIVMGVAFAFIWSSAFTSAKIALQDAPPFLFLAVRFAVAGLIACGAAALAGQRVPRDRRVWLLIVVFGVCQNALYLGLNFLAMTSVPAGLAAIIASALPLAVAAFSRVFLAERLPLLGIAGLLAGFAGVALIMAGRIAGGVDPVGVALCVGGLLALAAATLAVRGIRLDGGLLMVVGLQMLVGSAALAPVALAFESLDQVRPTLSLLLSFLYIVLVPGILATVIWFRLVARIGATAASAFHFLNPAFGVGAAALLLGERLGLLDLVGVAIVTAGIAAVQIARARAARGAGATG
jgi:drug/metabolite transporter (DMT)-like permease